MTRITHETVADTQLQLYRDRNGSGTSRRFFKSAKTALYTMANGAEAPTTDFGSPDDNPPILATGEVVYCGAALTKKITFSAE